MNCPECHFPVQQNDRFCASCGSPLGGATAGGAVSVGVATLAVDVSFIGKVVPIPRNCSCGAGPDQQGPDHICSVCGAVCIVPERDDFYAVLDDGFAVRSNLGLKHWRNEDYCVIGERTVAGIVVRWIVLSDGVSNSQNPDQASHDDCLAASKVIADSLDAGLPSDWQHVLSAAVAAAQQAVLQVAHEPTSKIDPAEATLVVAVLHGDIVDYAWLGDSRLYALIAENGQASLIMLTHDHSFINQVVDSHQMTIEEALKSRDAHAITRSLGPLAQGETLEPSYGTHNLAKDDKLLACTDGLWNDAHPNQDEPPTLLQQYLSTAGDTALDTANKLVDFANSHGGHDNVTVAIVTC